MPRHSAKDKKDAQEIAQLVQKFEDKYSEWRRLHAKPMITPLFLGYMTPTGLLESKRYQKAQSAQEKLSIIQGSHDTNIKNILDEVLHEKGKKPSVKK